MSINAQDIIIAVVFFILGLIIGVLFFADDADAAPALWAWAL